MLYSMTDLTAIYMYIGITFPDISIICLKIQGIADTITSFRNVEEKSWFRV